MVLSDLEHFVESHENYKFFTKIQVVNIINETLCGYFETTPNFGQLLTILPYKDYN